MGVEYYYLDWLSCVLMGTDGCIITLVVRGPVRVPYCCRLYLRLGDLSRSSR